MAKLDLNQETADTFAARLARIQDPAQRQWGTMPPDTLLRHLTFMFELSLGERTAEKVFIPIPRFLTWVVFFEWFTNWPKGKFKAPPPFFPAPEGDVNAEREVCIAALHRFVDTLNVHPEQTGYSPLLGTIPLRKWSRVHGVHLDHHLRQYGV